MTGAESDILRLRKMIKNGNLRIPNEAAKILKNDLITVLDGYFELDKKSVELSFLPDNTGIKLRLTAGVVGVKKIRTVQ